jgi:hypothetical protein
MNSHRTDRDASGSESGGGPQQHRHLDVGAECVDNGHVAQYSDSDYSAASLKVLTLREAVLRRPAMYFGSYPASDRPLVIAAWTATTLLDYAVGPDPQVDVTLHRGGGLSAEVVGARLTWPAAARLRPIDEMVRQRMWWHQLARSTTVTVHQNGNQPSTPQRTDDELAWNDLDIITRLELDADLIGTAPDEWWRDGLARLQSVFATDRFRLPPGHRVAITDEASEAVTHVPAHDLETE